MLFSNLSDEKNNKLLLVSANPRALAGKTLAIFQRVCMAHLTRLERHTLNAVETKHWSPINYGTRSEKTTDTIRRSFVSRRW